MVQNICDHHCRNFPPPESASPNGPRPILGMGHSETDIFSVAYLRFYT